MQPKHQNVSKTDAVGYDSASEKTVSQNMVGGCKVLLKATVPSEGVVERQLYA